MKHFFRRVDEGPEGVHRRKILFLNDARKHFLRLPKERKHFLRLPKERKHFLRLPKERKHFLRLPKERKHFLRLPKERKHFLRLPKERKHFLRLPKERKHFSDVLTKAQRAYTAEDMPAFKEIVSFECRGLAVVDFRFGVSGGVLEWKLIIFIALYNYIYSSDSEWVVGLQISRGNQNFGLSLYFVTMPPPP